MFQSLKLNQHMCATSMESDDYCFMRHDGCSLVSRPWRAPLVKLFSCSQTLNAEQCESEMAVLLFAKGLDTGRHTLNHCMLCASSQPQQLGWS